MSEINRASMSELLGKDSYLKVSPDFKGVMSTDRREVLMAEVAENYNDLYVTGFGDRLLRYNPMGQGDETTPNPIQCYFETATQGGYVVASMRYESTARIYGVDRHEFDGTTTLRYNGYKAEFTGALTAQHTSTQPKLFSTYNDLLYHVVGSSGDSFIRIYNLNGETLKSSTLSRTFANKNIDYTQFHGIHVDERGIYLISSSDILSMDHNFNVTDYGTGNLAFIGMAACITGNLVITYDDAEGQLSLWDRTTRELMGPPISTGYTEFAEDIFMAVYGDTIYMTGDGISFNAIPFKPPRTFLLFDPGEASGASFNKGDVLLIDNVKCNVLDVSDGGVGITVDAVFDAANGMMEVERLISNGSRLMYSNGNWVSAIEPAPSRPLDVLVNRTMKLSGKWNLNTVNTGAVIDISSKVTGGTTPTLANVTEHITSAIYAQGTYFLRRRDGNVYMYDHESLSGFTNPSELTTITFENDYYNQQHTQVSQALAGKNDTIGMTYNDTRGLLINYLAETDVIDYFSPKAIHNNRVPTGNFDTNMLTARAVLLTKGKEKHWGGISDSVTYYNAFMPPIASNIGKPVLDLNSRDVLSTAGAVLLRTDGKFMTFIGGESGKWYVSDGEIEHRVSNNGGYVGTTYNTWSENPAYLDGANCWGSDYSVSHYGDIAVSLRKDPRGSHVVITMMNMLSLEILYHEKEFTAALGDVVLVTDTKIFIISSETGSYANFDYNVPMARLEGRDLNGNDIDLREQVSLGEYINYDGKQQRVVDFAGTYGAPKGIIFPSIYSRYSGDSDVGELELLVTIQPGSLLTIDEDGTLIRNRREYGGSLSGLITARTDKPLSVEGINVLQLQGTFKLPPLSSVKPLEYVEVLLPTVFATLAPVIAADGNDVILITPEDDVPSVVLDKGVAVTKRFIATENGWIM